MDQAWLGVTISSEKITAVHAIVSPGVALEIVADTTWTLQSGERPAAYDVAYRWVADYVKEHGIRRVFIKASALSTGSTKLAHLQSAELRGVVIAAAASSCPTTLLAKAQLSKTFGDRKVDDYIADASFWEKEALGKPLRTGSRGAAFLLLAARDVA